MRRPPFRAALVAVSLLLPAVSAPLAAQQPSGTSGVLLLLVGSDTFSIERYRRTPRSLEAELLIRGANARFTISAHLTEQGTVERIEQAYRAGSADPQSPPIQSAVMRFAGDSVVAEITAGGSTNVRRFAAPAGVVPFLNPSMALADLIVQRARALGGDSVEVPIFNVQGGATATARVTRLPGDSVVLQLGAVPVRLALDGDGHIDGGTIPSQGLRIVHAPEGAGAAAAMSVPKPDYSAPPDAPYTSEDVRVPTPGGFTLAGTLTLPRGATAPVPAVVTITGSGQEDRDEAIPMVRGYRPFRQVADTLGRNGIAVLRLDDRGYGESGGDATRATSADFADDVRAALAWLRARPEIDGRRLALVGHSEGGLIAPMVAARDTALRAIVLMAGPSQSGRRIIDYQLRYSIDHSPRASAAARDSAYRRIPATIDSLAATPWMAFFLDYDPLTAARKVRTPTLILQGATDRQVTVAQAEELGAAIRSGGNRDVTVRIFPATNHLFAVDPDGSPAGYASLPHPAVRPEVLAEIVVWLRARLR
jgi:uncharacterized protein